MRQKVGHCQETKEAVEHLGDGDTTYNWDTWNAHLKAWTKTGRIGNQWKNRDPPE